MKKTFPKKTWTKSMIQKSSLIVHESSSLSSMMVSLGRGPLHPAPLLPCGDAAAVGSAKESKWLAGWPVG